MYLVAIAELGKNPVGPELGSLATELGTSAYDLRLVLNAGLPAVVLITAEQKLAASAADAIVRHGHAAVVCDRTKLTPSAQLTTLRHFELSAHELIADRASGEAMPLAELTVIVRAVHRSSQQSVEQVKERKLRPAMALATGGLVLSKTVTKEVTTTTSSREQVLYLFRRGAQQPWLLRERLANYAALGEAMALASFENFATTTKRLRELCPAAAYDERLMNSRPIRGIGDGGDAIDILAHVLAEHLHPSSPGSAVGR